MSHIKLILLDFDGTLADTRRANGEAYIQALSEVGITLSLEQYTAKYFGMRCREFLRDVGIESDDDARRLRQRKVEIYPNYFDSVRLNTPLWEWCKMMRSMGSQVWIVSTGHIDNIRNVMRHLKLSEGIDGIISGDDVTQPKPHPECFLRAMELAGATPRQTIIFEDSTMGLQAAEASGAAYVKVSL
ncbi:MAG: HAD family phosphatase [Alistipes sp.]|nr:HAD family phosphatase [Alistipes sp.]